MIKVFLPADKTYIKTNIRGFWKSLDNKIYYDYLSIYTLPLVNPQGKQKKLLHKLLQDFKEQYGQEAIAYEDIENRRMGVYYNKDKINILCG